MVERAAVTVHTTLYAEDTARSPVQTRSGAFYFRLGSQTTFVIFFSSSITNCTNTKIFVTFIFQYEWFFTMRSKQQPKEFTGKLSKQFKRYTNSIDVDKIKETSQKLVQDIAQRGNVLGKGVIDGTTSLGKGTVVAASSIKQGVEAGFGGVKHLFGITAEKLHLKKPDMRALDELEQEISPYLPTEAVKRWYMKNIKLRPKNSDGELVLKWNRVFCWHDDPFTLGLKQPIDNFFVCEKKMKTGLNFFLVKQQQFGKIIGERGSGKTTFLHWIYWELEAHHPEIVPCFVNAAQKNVGERALVRDLMLPFINIYQKTVSRPFEDISISELAQYIKRKTKYKQFVILVDEAHNLSDKAMQIFLELKMAQIKMQIIVTGRKEDLHKSKLVASEKDMLKFELSGLSVELATELLRRRIEAMGGDGTYPFDAQKIRVIVQQVKGNPADLLQKAKEKAIQISINQHKEIVAEQQEIIKQREEEIRQKLLNRKERKHKEREEKRLKIEEERRKHIEEEKKKSEEELHRQQELLEKEDVQLEKIDDMIGTIVSGTINKEKDKISDYSELAKHDSLVEEAIGRIPEEKDAKQILEEDPDLVADLQHVLEETDAAAKRQQHKVKKKR